MKSLQYDIVQTTGSLGSLLYTTTYTDHFSSVANQIEKPLPNGDNLAERPYSIHLQWNQF